MSEPYSWQNTIEPLYVFRLGFRRCMPRRLVPSKLRNRTISPCSGTKSNGFIDNGGGVSTKMVRQILTYFANRRTTNITSDAQVKTMANAAQLRVSQGPAWAMVMH